MNSTPYGVHQYVTITRTYQLEVYRTFEKQWSAAVKYTISNSFVLAQAEVKIQVMCRIA
jgi:hypothetical protein